MSFIIVSQRRLFAETLTAVLSQNGLDVLGAYPTLSDVPEQLDDPSIILHIVAGNLPVIAEIETFRQRIGEPSIVILGSAAVVGEISHEVSAAVEAVITDDLSAVSLIGLLSAVREGFRISLPEEKRRQRERRQTGEGFAAQSTEGLQVLRPPNGVGNGAKAGQEVETDPDAQNTAAPMATLEQIARETRLSARELAVIQRLRDGASNKDIAKRLNIVENTVKVHLRSCYRKIGVKNRTQAAVWAAKYLPR